MVLALGEDRTVTLDLALSEKGAGGTMRLKRVDTGRNAWKAVQVDLCAEEEQCRSSLVAYLPRPEERAGPTGGPARPA